MKLVEFRKESSERSDSDNWSKSILQEKTPYHFDSIEGCNQNTANEVTHLIERARVTAIEGKSNKQEIIASIIELEGREVLQRKINFANCFNVPLLYALYCDENENVFLFNFISLENIEFERHYKSYLEFANWIAEIKGWVSNKAFREIDDLPYFDKQLRKHKTPWPTNIDCFVSDVENNPIAIIEYQNAKDTGVLEHCNNDHFQCKLSFTKNGYYGPYTVYSDDIRRWTSQEILRVQSTLKLIIITWSQNSSDFQIKELESVAIPFFPETNGKPDWKEMSAYKGDLNKYIKSNRSDEIKKTISSNRKTYNLYKTDEGISSSVNEPPLSYEAKTFPSLYYNSKEKVENNKMGLIDAFLKIINS